MCLKKIITENAEKHVFSDNFFQTHSVFACSQQQQWISIWISIDVQISDPTYK
jgi:hypothetical protein